jgi:hypothetical protein
MYFFNAIDREQKGCLEYKYVVAHASTSKVTVTNATKTLQ